MAQCPDILLRVTVACSLNSKHFCSTTFLLFLDHDKMAEEPKQHLWVGTSYTSQHRDRYKSSIPLSATNLTTVILKVLPVVFMLLFCFFFFFSVMSNFSGFIKRNWHRIKSCGTILTNLTVFVNPEGEARHLVTCKSSLKFSLAASEVLYMQFMWYTCKWNAKAYAALSHTTLFLYEAVSFSFRKKNNLGYNWQFKLECQRLNAVIIQFCTK